MNEEDERAADEEVPGDNLALPSGVCTYGVRSRVPIVLPPSWVRLSLFAWWDFLGV